MRISRPQSHIGGMSGKTRERSFWSKSIGEFADRPVKLAPKSLLYLNLVLWHNSILYTWKHWKSWASSRIYKLNVIKSRTQLGIDCKILKFLHEIGGVLFHCDVFSLQAATYAVFHIYENFQENHVGTLEYSFLFFLYIHKCPTRVSENAFFSGVFMSNLLCRFYEVPV